MNEQERYLFDLQGFLLVRDALTPEQVAALNELLDAQVAAKAQDEMRTQRFGGLLSWGEATRDLITNPHIAPYLAEMLGENYRLDHDYADVIRAGLGPIGATLHGGGAPFDPSQYYLFRDGRMYNGLTVVAYNLRDVNPGDGGFGCVPGSHKANYRLPGEWRDLENPAPFVQAVPGPAGSAVIFTEALTHGTMPWKGAGERRTVFLKYCPRPVAWARRGYDTEQPDLSDDLRRVLASPGISPKPGTEKGR
jgi:hypothetical protein